MKNQSYHRRRSIRLQGYDYSQPGAYFITIVTHERLNIFGQIIDDVMQLNKVGQIVATEWERLPQRFAHVQIDAMVIMPNHIHGILILGDGRGTGVTVHDLIPDDNPRAPTGVTVHKLIPDDNPRAPTVEQFGKPVPGSVPTIIRSYKSSVTQRVLWSGRGTGEGTQNSDIIEDPRAPTNTPLWQRNYYEHVVRNEDDLCRIRQYIMDNPLHWSTDEEYKP